MTKFTLKIVTLFALLLLKYWMFPEEGSEKLNTHYGPEVIKLVDQPVSDSSSVSL